MIVTIHTAGLQTLAQIRAFVDGNAPIAFTLTDRTAAQQWMTDTLRRFNYRHGTRADKGLLRRYLAKVTSSSRVQMTRAINSTLSHSFQSHGGPSIARCLGFLPQAVALSDDLGEFSRRHVSSG